jgi:hypothetical protein
MAAASASLISNSSDRVRNHEGVSNRIAVLPLAQVHVRKKDAGGRLLDVGGWSAARAANRARTSSASSAAWCGQCGMPGVGRHRHDHRSLVLVTPMSHLI